MLPEVGDKERNLVIIQKVEETPRGILESGDGGKEAAGR